MKDGPMKNLPLWIIGSLVLAIVIVAGSRSERTNVCPNPEIGSQHPWEICPPTKG